MTTDTQLPVPADHLHLATLEEDDNSPPSDRLEDAALARELGAKLVENDRERSHYRALVDGMLDGNPPFNSAQLKRLGQGYRANLNFREGEGVLNSAKTPYYDLLSEVQSLIQINCMPPDVDPYRADRFARIIAQHYTTMVRSWDGWDFQMQLSQRQMLAHGVGPCVWENEKDWKFRALQNGMVFVPDRQLASVPELEVIIIRQSYSISSLWKKVANKKAAKLAGWNVREAIRAMSNARPKTDDEPNAISPEQFQRRMRVADLYEGVRSSTVSVFHVYVREFDDSITHGIVCEDGDAKEWLFRKRNAAENFSEVIVPFFYDVGTGEWHSIIGLGKKIFPHVEVSTRLHCQMIDNAFIGSSIMLQQQNEEDTERTQLMQLGPLSIIPPGYSIQPGTIFADLQGPLAVRNALSESLVNNTGSYRMRATPPAQSQGNPRTATEVQAEESTRSYLGKGDIARYYQGLDLLHREMFKRALKGPDEDSKLFLKRCVADGVPEEVIKSFKQFYDVYATRAIGQGSSFQRQQSIRELYSLMGVLDDKGKKNVVEDYVASLVGQTKVDRYITPAELADEITDQEAFATLENAALKAGAPVLVTSTQSHTRHAQVHLKAGVDAINAVAQGAALEEVVPFLEGVGQHIAQHMQRLQGDPTRGQETSLLMQQFEQFGNIVDELKNRLVQKQKGEAEQAAKAQAEAQQQAPPDPKNVAAAEKMRLDLEFTRQKHAEELRQMQEKHAVQMQTISQQNAAKAAGNVVTGVTEKIE